MIITSHMQKIIQIYPCLLKLSHKQDTITLYQYWWFFNQKLRSKPLLQIFPCKNPSTIMIITSHMQKIIQIYPCLLKLSRKQESVTTDGRYYYILSPLSRRDNKKYLKFQTKVTIYVLLFLYNFNLLCTRYQSLLV